MGMMPFQLVVATSCSVVNLGFIWKNPDEVKNGPKNTMFLASRFLRMLTYGARAMDVKLIA